MAPSVLKSAPEREQGVAGRKRNIRRFKQVAAQQRRNSQSIRRMLYDIIERRFGRSVDKASSHLSAALTSIRDHRGYHRGMTAESLYRTSRDDYFMTYSQLDAMAQIHRVPLSVLLLFTRVRSEMETPERRRAGEAQRIISAFREALNHLDELAMEANRSDEDIYQMLDYGAFEAFVEVYLDKFDETLL